MEQSALGKSCLVKSTKKTRKLRTPIIRPALQPSAYAGLMPGCKQNQKAWKDIYELHPRGENDWRMIALALQKSEALRAW